LVDFGDLGLYGRRLPPVLPTAHGDLALGLVLGMVLALDLVLGMVLALDLVPALGGFVK